MTEDSKICPPKPKSLKYAKYIVDEDYDLLTNYPTKELVAKLDSMKLFKKYGKMLPSEINDKIIYLRCIPALSGFLSIWHEWCLKLLFQNKKHYCTSWTMIDCKNETYTVL